MAVAASCLADVAADSSSLSLMSGSALGRASAGPSGFSGLQNRLRGGAADLKEKVTGITFSGSLKAGGKNLEVKPRPHYWHASLSYCQSSARSASSLLRHDIKHVPTRPLAHRWGQRETWPGLTLAPQVVGAGDRKKKIVGPVAVNVYAIGMYVDPVGAKAAGATVKKQTSLRG